MYLDYVVDGIMTFNLTIDSSLIIISYCPNLFVTITLHVQTLLRLKKKFLIEFFKNNVFLPYLR